MRKIVISLITCLLLVGTVYFMIKGNEVINVQGFIGINDKDKEIDSSISKLSETISVTYVSTDAGLKRTANTLMETKTEYENQAILSKTNNSGYASGKEAYDIDYLWTKLGNYAKEENVIIKIEVVASDVSVNLYNLNFTVTGDYTNITNFIYDIENDSRLGFKIDAFTMIGSSETLNATFECREIFISVGDVDGSSNTNVSAGNITSSNRADGVSVQVNPNQNTINQNTTNQNETNQSTTNGVTPNSNSSGESGTAVGTENIEDYSV